MITIKEILYSTRNLFKENSITDSNLESDLILAFALKITRSQLHAHINSVVTEKEHSIINGLIKRRITNEPLAYILGFREFFGNNFIVNPSVLIPRQETECLVEIVIKYLQNLPTINPIILDVGCGSGVIGGSLLNIFPNINLISIDISRDALILTDKNIINTIKSTNYNLVLGDLLSAIKGPVDLIIANLPYIPSDRISTLQNEVKFYEPIKALDGGRNGLQLISQLIDQSKTILSTDGALFLEIDPDQKIKVETKLQNTFHEHTAKTTQDLSGKDRVVALTRL